MKTNRIKSLLVARPCINCIYYSNCGSTTRTEPCAGRMTKTDKKKEANK